MIYRNAKILDLARESPCQCCGKDDGTIVAAHSNQIRDGKGTGIKAEDFRIAYLCHQCHHELDNGKQFSREERALIWEDAHRSTIGWLFKMGHIKII